MPRQRKYDYNLIKSLYEQGLNYKGIEKVTGCPSEQIPRILKYAKENKRGKQGELCHHNKLSEEDVIEVYRFDFLGESGREIAAKFGITPSNVSAILRGKSWKKLYAQKENYHKLKTK